MPAVPDSATVDATPLRQPSRPIRRHRGRRGVWKRAAADSDGDWSAATLAAMAADTGAPAPAIANAGRQPAAWSRRPDASLAERVARLGRVYDRLLALTAGERAHRAAGKTRTASDLGAVRVDVLDALSSAERDEMLLIAIGRAAPGLRLCQDCGGLAGAGHACARCPVSHPGEQTPEPELVDTAGGTSGG